MQRPEYTHMNKSTETGHNPNALQQRLEGLMHQTAYKLTENELREWAKILMGSRAKTDVVRAAPAAAGMATHLIQGLGTALNKGMAKKAAIAAIGAGIGYLLITRRR